MISKEVEETQKTNAGPTSFSSLPDEITENILARVSRWNYPWLSLVSKKFHSLLSPKEIYKIRSQIGAKETCVYVSLQLPNQPYPSWFSLWSKPIQTPTKRRGKIRFKQNPNGNAVVPIPLSSSYPLPLSTASSEVGSEIYIIGGSLKEPSSSVRIFDCRSHTWRDAPSMTVARIDASLMLLDEKIYVTGGCEIDKYSANWTEVFDIETQSWTALPGPGDDDEELRDQLRCCCNIIDEFEGKFYVATNENDYIYEPKNGTWKVIKEQSSFLDAEMWCWIENVVCCYTYSNYLMWCEPYKWEWKEIKGLEKLHEHRTRGLKIGDVLFMDNYDGKLLAMWDPYPNRRISSIKMENKIWYAMISLKSRCNGREVWGNVECVDVLTFPGESYENLLCFTASV